MPVQLITPPASEPVTLGEAKDHLRLEHALDDAYITTLISAARQHIEQACWRGLVTQTWELVLESFAGEDTLELGTRGRRYGSGQSGFNELPRGNLSSSGFLAYIELPKGNLGTVTSVKYIDVNGVEQTLASTEYAVDAVDVPGRVRLAYGKFWPPTLCPRWDAVRIQYTVGWAVTNAVWAGPTPLKQALLLLLSQMYENRSPEVIGVPTAFDILTSPYRLVRL
jgi:hypothetical protein